MLFKANANESQMNLCVALVTEAHEKPRTLVRRNVPPKPDQIKRKLYGTKKKKKKGGGPFRAVNTYFA